MVTGAGPVGLLAALLGVQRGLEVHVFDRVTDGPKPQLVADLGATYHSETLPDSGLEADVLLECTGVPTVVVDVLTHSATDSVACLTGVSSIGQPAAAGHRRAQPQGGAAQRRRVRHGQRQPPPLRGRRRRAGGRRPRTGSHG